MSFFFEIFGHPAFIAAASVILGGTAIAVAFHSRKTQSIEDPTDSSWDPGQSWMAPQFDGERTLSTARPGPAALRAPVHARPAPHASAQPVDSGCEGRVKPDVGFGDVAGVDEAVQELREIKEYVRYPGPFRALGARLAKGILLYGPPGTGKTLLARALAAESNVNFYSASGAGFVEVYVGMGAARVRRLFEEAKKNQPAVVFIDELDAVGRSRVEGANANEEREGTLNQLLIEMDGFEAGAGVMVVAATNRLDVLDPALMRSGRFDRRIPVDLPDVVASASTTNVRRVFRAERLRLAAFSVGHVPSGTHPPCGLATLAFRAAKHRQR